MELNNTDLFENDISELIAKAKVLTQLNATHLSTNETIKNYQNILLKVRAGSSFFCAKAGEISMDLPTRIATRIEQIIINKSKIWGK